ncbi:Qat anti-phage system associated protein QatB [Sinorhizobium meliloti]|uniref:Qat anti-phage system associated protein QatB n=1 Tax=Rhizobium meliloti TaxID=382 RepID=UPI00299DA2D6
MPAAGEGAPDAGADPASPPDTPAQPPGPPPPVPVAPAARFRGARRSLGEFARTGDSRDLRRGLGHYVRSGYGGSPTATRRFGGTAATAGSLYGALSGAAAGEPRESGSPLDPVLLAGRSVDEVMDAVVEAVRPIDGTQDTEAARAAIREALTELLTRYPDADLLSLDPDQRSFVIERYSAIDVFRRFDLDLGQTIRDKAPSATTGLSRLKQVRDYVREAVAASFRKLRDAGHAVTAGRVSQVVRDALRDTFEVFEGYAE